MDDDVIRSKAGTAITNGKIPIDAPQRMWGGGGTGATCVVCDLPITGEEVEIDVEFDRNSGSSHVDKYQFHLQCLTAWERERVHRGPAEDLRRQ